MDELNSRTRKIPSRRRQLHERVANPRLELKLGKKTPADILERRIWFWRKLSHAGQLCEIYPEEIEIATASELLILASICVEAGLITQGADLVRVAVSRDPDVLDKGRYIGMIEAVSNVLDFVRDRYAIEIGLAREYKRGFGRFAGLVLENAASIAVVGNSPVTMGKKLGKEIDECKLVVRFNNYSVSPEYRADYGSKTSVWFRPRDYKWLWRRDAERYAHIVYAWPGFYYRYINGQDVLFDSQMTGRTIEEVPTGIFRELRDKHLILAPSAGLLALCWIYSILGSLENVLIAGFMMTDQNKGETVHYFNQGHPQPVLNHDWAMERKVLEQIAPSSIIPASN